MLVLALRWWWDGGGLESVILALGLALSFAQSFRPEIDRAAAQRLWVDAKLKLQAAFPRSDIDWQHAARRPMEQWQSDRLIIRSLGDQTYPGGDQPHHHGVFSWFGAELYDFYDNGIMIFRDVVRVALDSEGNWALLESDDHEQAFLGSLRLGKAFRLGCIPFSDVADVDPHGDAYYTSPMVFCRYAFNGTPFEDERFVLIGEDRDEPLSPQRRFFLERPAVRR